MAAPPTVFNSSIDDLLAKAVSHHQNYRFAEAERLYRQILGAEPKHADALHLLGLVACQAGNLSEASSLIQSAICLNPKDAAYHSNLGNVLQLQGDLQAALVAYQCALSLRPRYVEALGNLGSLLERLGKPDEALAAFQAALAIDPDSAESHNGLAATLLTLGDLERSRAHLDRAQAIEPDNALVRYNQAMIHLLFGDYLRGFEAYEWRWKLRAKRHSDQPRWNGCPLAGASILLYAEQGLGDTLQFLRFVPLVQQAGGSVWLELQPGLLRLAAQIPAIAGVIAVGEPMPLFQWECPLMSLPLIFKTQVTNIPVNIALQIPDAAMEKADLLFRSFLAGGVGRKPDYDPPHALHVGLVWAGNRAHAKDAYRSIAIQVFEPLFSAGKPIGVEGGELTDCVGTIRFFSLQMGEALSSWFKATISDLAPATSDLADTAAQIAHLDLIITVDTSIAHLAGALQKPVWILLSASADWRWLLGRDDSPWYPTARLFRQSTLGDWHSVMLRVKDELLRFRMNTQANRSANLNDFAASGRGHFGALDDVPGNGVELSSVQ